MGRVRTRFAPSPTGPLHIGNARTALFNFLYALGHDGEFILRIEDTDTARSTKEFEKAIFEDLLWLGLSWDEGPGAGGEKGPYRQSERLDIYREYAAALIEKGLAYRCGCTRERLEELKRSQLAKGQPPRYDGRCRDRDVSQSSSVIRFRVPERAVSFTDGVHGPIESGTSAFGDFVIIGSDGVASYNFAVVIDDALMAITDIIRGDDHISNTPRQVLLFEALGLKLPRYAHIPLILGPERAPLSKRDNSYSLRRLREEGYLPEAIINAIARLGWSPGEEFMDLLGLSKLFSVEKLSKSPSLFDIDRLKFYNKTAIENLDNLRLLKLSGLEASGFGREDLLDIVAAVKGNASTVEEIKSLAGPFITSPELTPEARQAVDEPGAREVVRSLRVELERAGKADEASCKTVMDSVKKSTGKKGRELFMPIRAALTGRTDGIEIAKVLSLLGVDEATRRLRAFE